jgi:probable F420-dependent oxidoreductase
MRLGATVPRNSLPEGRGDILTTVAEAAERAGLASLWMSDHLIMVEGAHGYPYTDDGSFSRSGATPWYEALSVLSWIAARSTNLKVGTAVLIVPQRNPLELAKVTATIDNLSRGRLMLGVGAGWLQEEFEVLGPDYASRGLRLDSAMDVMRAAWSGHVPAGEYGNVHVPHDAFSYPRPEHDTGVPILVGGMTERAVRRVIERGDGWLARAWIDELADAPLELADKISRIRAAPVRPGGPPRYNMLRLVARDGQPAMDADGTPHPVLIQAIATARELGFDEAAFDVDWSSGAVERELRGLQHAVA